MNQVKLIFLKKIFQKLFQGKNISITPPARSTKIGVREKVVICRYLSFFLMNENDYIKRNGLVFLLKKVKIKKS
jgi:hypothetical protein